MRELRLKIMAVENPDTPDGWTVGVSIESSVAEGVPTILTIVENGLMNRIEQGLHKVLAGLGIGEHNEG